MITRRSGILLHITSLPSPHGIGDLGPWAYRFVDFLQEAKQGFWQILPLNPTSTAYGNSPYSSCSAFAGNPLFICLERLIEVDLLSWSDLEDSPSFHRERVDYAAVAAYKTNLLRTAYERFKASGRERDPDFQSFYRTNGRWLEDYALFVALKEHFAGAPWYEWPREVRDRERQVIAKARAEHANRVLQEIFLQYLFTTQWHALKDYCNSRHIQIIGDIPIYVSLDSSDVWSNPGIFKLDAEKRPTFVAGVPPDYFSPTGQRWGNPVYDWDALRRGGYAWWIYRLEHNLRLFDLVRLDHFRGFAGFWEVPSAEETAINGKWVEAPASDFFATLNKRFPLFPIIAEDLGIITPDVREVMRHYRMPGMKVLQFAFFGDVRTNPYAPHNHVRECVVYTGTHDNNTTKGWFRNELSPADKDQLLEYLGRFLNENEIHWELITVAMMSVANTCIIPLQDFLGLDEGARLNTPSTAHGNWEWRFLPEGLTGDLSQRIGKMTSIYGRG